MAQNSYSTILSLLHAGQTTMLDDTVVPHRRHSRMTVASARYPMSCAANSHYHGCEYERDDEVLNRLHAGFETDGGGSDTDCDTE